MGKALKLVLLVILFTIAFGSALLREAGTEAKPLYKCTSPYDCRLTGCPCVNGKCQCQETSEAAEENSRKLTQQAKKSQTSMFW
ncbi:hypothetical protein BVRB_6g154460 [Beta vulgaris subsp. vulgaris]|nr:hypothetical protein BVRB_6g154460 [Beta vulgaris subsp. vulgaris]